MCIGYYAAVAIIIFGWRQINKTRSILLLPTSAVNRYCTINAVYSFNSTNFTYNTNIVHDIQYIGCIANVPTVISCCALRSYLNVKTALGFDEYPPDFVIEKCYLHNAHTVGYWPYGGVLSRPLLTNCTHIIAICTNVRRIKYVHT